MKRITCVRFQGMTNLDGEHFQVAIVDDMYKIDGVVRDAQGCQVDEHIDKNLLMEQCYIIRDALKRIEEIEIQK